MILTKNMLDVTEANVVKNDMLFFASVLSKIDEVVSYTYGPKAGYVARVESEDRGTGFTYTKDGMATLNKLQFSRNAELDVARMVTNLAFEMKKHSGDGSTTAAKLLYSLVRNSAEVIQSGGKEIHEFRINTPKGKDILIDKIEKAFAMNEENVERFPNRGMGGVDDIEPAAFISLNNDRKLTEPFVELANYIRDNSIELDDSFMVMALQGSGDRTYVDTKPGFMLGTPKFILNENRDKISRAKLIMLNITLTYDMMQYVILPMLDLVQQETKNADGEPEKIVFLVNDIEDDTKILLQQVYKSMVNDKNEPRFEFISSRVVYAKLSRMEKDLSYLTESDIINFDENMLEKRSKIEPLYVGNEVQTEDDIDNQNTTALMKWTARFTRDSRGRVIKKDYYYGFRLFKEKFFKNVEKAKYVDITRTEGAGLTLTLSDGENRSELFNNYLKEIKEEAKSQDPEVANAAKERLYHLNDKIFIINVAKTKYDDDRLYTAYRDAAGSVTSIVKHGYHMGGSVGLLETLMDIEKEIRFEYGLKKETGEVRKEELKGYEAALFIMRILVFSVLELITTLLADIKGDGLYDRTTEPNVIIQNYKDAVKNEDIKPSEFLFNDVKVISPIESDLVMIKMVLNQFSNLFSSLCVEYIDPMDVIYFTKITNDIKNRIKKETERQDKIIAEAKEDLKKDALGGDNGNIETEEVKEAKPSEIKPEVPEEKITEPSLPVVEKRSTEVYESNHPEVKPNNNVEEVERKIYEVKPEIAPTMKEEVKEVEERKEKTPEEMDVDDIIKKRQEEAKRKLARMEHDRLESVAKYIMPGPMDFTISTDDPDQVPGWVGRTLTPNDIDKFKAQAGYGEYEPPVTQGSFKAVPLDDDK